MNIIKKLRKIFFYICLYIKMTNKGYQKTNKNIFYFYLSICKNDK